MIFPTVLNSLSGGTLVAHIHKYFVPILPVKGIDDAVIATTVVGWIQYLEGDSECIVQVPFPHSGNDSREAFA